jgi:plastocyanin
MRRALGGALAVALLAAVPAGADTIDVHVQFQAFEPAQIDALPRDTVRWSNISERTHTVTADAGAFASADLLAATQFAWGVASATGRYAYHCTIHFGMVGAIDVRRVTLGSVPVAPVPAGTPIHLSGRTSEPGQAVTIERDAGSGFRPIAHAAPAPDGRWATDTKAEATADYRAVIGPDASESRHLLVIDRHVNVTRTRHGLHVTVVPADPYAQLLLERRSRERFGWFPARRTRLDYLSRADFTVARRPAKVRVKLVDVDGWTALATSSVVRLARAPR